MCPWVVGNPINTHLISLIADIHRQILGLKSPKDHVVCLFKPCLINSICNRLTPTDF